MKKGLVIGIVVCAILFTIVIVLVPLIYVSSDVVVEQTERTETLSSLSKNIPSIHLRTANTNQTIEEGNSYSENVVISTSNERTDLLISIDNTLLPLTLPPGQFEIHIPHEPFQPRRRVSIPISLEETVSFTIDKQKPQVTLYTGTNWDVPIEPDSIVNRLRVVLNSADCDGSCTWSLKQASGEFVMIPDTDIIKPTEHANWYYQFAPNLIGKQAMCIRDGAGNAICFSVSIDPSTPFFEMRGELTNTRIAISEMLSPTTRVVTAEPVRLLPLETNVLYTAAESDVSIPAVPSVFLPLPIEGVVFRRRFVVFSVMDQAKNIYSRLHDTETFSVCHVEIDLSAPQIAFYQCTDQKQASQTPLLDGDIVYKPNVVRMVRGIAEDACSLSSITKDGTQITPTSIGYQTLFTNDTFTFTEPGWYSLLLQDRVRNTLNVSFTIAEQHGFVVRREADSTVVGNGSILGRPCRVELLDGTLASNLIITSKDISILSPVRFPFLLSNPGKVVTYHISTRNNTMPTAYSVTIDQSLPNITVRQFGNANKVFHPTSPIYTYLPVELVLTNMDTTSGVLYCSINNQPPIRLDSYRPSYVLANEGLYVLSIASSSGVFSVSYVVHIHPLFEFVELLDNANHPITFTNGCVNLSSKGFKIRLAASSPRLLVTYSVGASDSPQILRQLAPREILEFPDSSTNYYNFTIATITKQQALVIGNIFVSAPTPQLILESEPSPSMWITADLSKSSTFCFDQAANTFPKRIPNIMRPRVRAMHATVIEYKISPEAPWKEAETVSDGSDSLLFAETFNDFCCYAFRAKNQDVVSDAILFEKTPEVAYTIANRLLERNSHHRLDIGQRIIGRFRNGSKALDYLLTVTRNKQFVSTPSIVASGLDGMAIADVGNLEGLYQFDVHSATTKLLLHRQFVTIDHTAPKLQYRLGNERSVQNLQDGDIILLMPHLDHTYVTIPFPNERFASPLSLVLESKLYPWTSNDIVIRYAQSQMIVCMNQSTFPIYTLLSSQMKLIVQDAAGNQTSVRVKFINSIPFMQVRYADECKSRPEHLLDTFTDTKSSTSSIDAFYLVHFRFFQFESCIIQLEKDGKDPVRITSSEMTIAKPGLYTLIIVDALTLVKHHVYKFRVLSKPQFVYPTQPANKDITVHNNEEHFSMKLEIQRLVWSCSKLLAPKSAYVIPVPSVPSSREKVVVAYTREHDQTELRVFGAPTTHYATLMFDTRLDAAVHLARDSSLAKCVGDNSEEELNIVATSPYESELTVIDNGTKLQKVSSALYTSIYSWSTGYYPIRGDGKHSVDVRDANGNAHTYQFLIDTRRPMYGLFTSQTEQTGTFIDHSAVIIRTNEPLELKNKEIDMPIWYSINDDKVKHKIAPATSVSLLPDPSTNDIQFKLRVFCEEHGNALPTTTYNIHIQTHLDIFVQCENCIIPSNENNVFVCQGEICELLVSHPSDIKEQTLQVTDDQIGLLSPVRYDEQMHCQVYQVKQDGNHAIYISDMFGNKRIVHIAKASSLEIIADSQYTQERLSQFPVSIKAIKDNGSISWSTSDVSPMHLVPAVLRTPLELILPSSHSSVYYDVAQSSTPMLTGSQSVYIPSKHITVQQDGNVYVSVRKSIRHPFLTRPVVLYRHLAFIIDQQPKFIVRVIQQGDLIQTGDRVISPVEICLEEAMQSGSINGTPVSMLANGTVYRDEFKTDGLYTVQFQNLYGQTKTITFTLSVQLQVSLTWNQHEIPQSLNPTTYIYKTRGASHPSSTNIVAAPILLETNGVPFDAFQVLVGHNGGSMNSVVITSDVFHLEGTYQVEVKWNRLPTIKGSSSIIYSRSFSVDNSPLVEFYAKEKDDTTYLIESEDIEEAHFQLTKQPTYLEPKELVNIDVVHIQANGSKVVVESVTDLVDQRLYLPTKAGTYEVHITDALFNYSLYRFSVL